MIRVTGRITADGRLELELPSGLEPGEVVVTVEHLAADDGDSEFLPWTEEEIAEMLTPSQPKTGAEIAARIQAEGGAWEDKLITDSETWVQEQRKKRQERT